MIAKQKIKLISLLCVCAVFVPDFIMFFWLEVKPPFIWGLFRMVLHFPLLILEAMGPTGPVGTEFGILIAPVVWFVLIYNLLCWWKRDPRANDDARIK